MVAVKARKATAYLVTLVFFVTAAMALLRGASTIEAFLKAGALCLVCTGLMLPLLRLVEEAMEKAAQTAIDGQRRVAAVTAAEAGNLQDANKSQ